MCVYIYIYIYILYIISNAFFSIQPQCCFDWLELQMLLRCCLINISITILRHCIFTLTVSLFRSRFTYVVSIWSIFIFIFIIINSTILWRQTHLFFSLVFRICSVIFGWWRVTNMTNFEVAKVQPQVVTYYLLNFLPISACRCL